MATSQTISCSEFATFLVSQEPYYDQEILSDIRPENSEFMGYYDTAPYNAYTSDSHTFDRLNSVFPDLTKAWNAVNNANCLTPGPCSFEENLIGYGSTRHEYGLFRQSWATDLFCFEQQMSRTRAREHMKQVFDKILRPTTQYVMSDYINKSTLANALYKICVSAGLPAFTFTWDAYGYVYLNTTQNPTGILTPNILRTFVRQQYLNGAIAANKDTFQALELQTDMDTYHYLSKLDPTLLDAWRFGDFGPAAKEFNEYGFHGFVGNFMVKVLQMPLRFNKVAAGRYQLILPYVNVSATEGIKSLPNPDYNNAQYQISYINNKRGMKVMPFKASALNPNMPYMVRDYGGSWKFGMNNLGADCNGVAIDNVRMNKGKFYADFQLAIKPQYPEFQIALFHMVDKACVTIIAPCNSDPGYPSQDYNDANDLCPTVVRLVPVAQSNGHYVIAANSALCDGNVLANGAINAANIAALVIALQADSKLGALGTWSTATITLDGASTVVLYLTDATCTTLTLPFVVG
jgi:hypothetical protein